MARLPSVGGDNGQWGQLLNDFLSVEHNPDGTLKKAGDISSAQAAANAAQIDANNAQSTANSKYTLPGSGIPETDLDSSVQTKLNAGASGVPDATTTIKGKLQLAGDLTGTASSPQITAGAVTDAKIAIGANIGQSKIQNLTSDLAAKYVKPGSGVPLGDLAAGIQTSLGKSDTAEQAANKGQAGGYASLDGAGKVPSSQLPNAIMRYQGVWNASTNSPVLTDGSGDAGDVYRVSVAGSQNLGSGSISFEVGDYAVYNPSGVWEKSDTTDSVASVAGKTGVVTLTSADVGLGNVPNTDATLRANHTGSQTASTISDFAAAADARITLQKGALGGVATLDGAGKIPGTQLPALAITNTFTAANQAAQLALSAQEGDLAIRTDEGKTYVHNGGTAGTMADWSELLSVGDQASLAGKVAKAGDTMTGALTINAAASGTAGNGTSQLSLNPATSVSGASLLHFNIDRAWDFGQTGTGAGTGLLLRALSTDKYFDILANGSSTRTLSVLASTTATSNAIGIYGQPVAGQGAMQFASTATGGLAMYNTTDQTTNYERGAIRWNSNVYQIATEYGGTGNNIRALQVGVASVAGNNTLTRYLQVGAASSPFIFHSGTQSAAGTVVAVGTASSFLTASSGTQNYVSITPNVNQTSTAAYTALHINSTETSTGSGSKLLADFQVGGTSRFAVSSTGVTSIASTANNGLLLYNTTDQSTNYERLRISWSSNVSYIVTEPGGTGTNRDLFIGSTTSSGLLMGSGANAFAFTRSNTAIASLMGLTSTGLTGTGGTQIGFQINPVINQSATAGYTMFLVNPSHVAVGSGNKLLADFQLGSSSKTVIDTNGYIGIAATSSVPTAPITIGSTQSANGIVLFDTSDQTTNYSRLRIIDTSNVFNIVTEWAGSAAARVLRIGTAATAGSANSRFIEFNAAAPFYRFTFGSTGLTGNMIDFTGSSMSQASATNSVLAINPTITQTGTAGSIMLDVNPTVTTVGSGTQWLARFAVGGTTRTSISQNGILANTGTISNLSGTYGSVVNTANYTLASDDGNGLFMLAFQNYATYNSTVNKTVGGSFIGGIFAQTTVSGTGGTPIKSFDSAIQVTGGATISLARGLHLRSPSVTSGTVTINAGIYIEAQQPANVTTGYGIYFNGTATNGLDIVWNNDTNLYRAAADTLKTDDAFVIGSNRLNIAIAKTPASASDTGTTGDIAWDANYMYVCVATNTWKRSPINTW